MLRKYRIHLTCMLFLILLLSILTACSSTMPEGLTIAGVPVGGFSKEEAIAVVSDYFDQTYSTRHMNLQINDQSFSISPESTKIQLDTTAAVEAAFSGKSSGAFDISPYLTVDETSIRNILEQIRNDHFLSTFSESTFTLVGDTPDLEAHPTEEELQTLVLTIGTPVMDLDINTLMEIVLDAFCTGTFYVEYNTEIISPDTPDPEEILLQVYTEPVDAVMDMETFDVSPHKYGYTIDMEYAKSAIQSASFGDIVEIPLLLLEPAITSDSLLSLLYRDTLSTHTATSSSQWGRDINLKLSCEAINGTILMPGEIFSYNPALGKRTPDKGWQKADGYSGMETVSEYGGGICQASSCLYLCALLADMEIVERVNHGFISSYMPYGMDATVSWGGPEFRFQNNSPYPIRIEAYASGGSVTVSLIGTETKDYYVKMQYEIKKTDPYETVEQEFPPNNAEGYVDGQVLITPYTGYEIITYRCKYDKETDELISREQEAYSIYNRRDKVICKIVDPEVQPPAESETLS